MRTSPFEFLITLAKNRYTRRVSVSSAHRAPRKKLYVRAEHGFHFSRLPPFPRRCGPPISLSSVISEACDFFYRSNSLDSGVPVQPRANAVNAPATHVISESSDFFCATRPTNLFVGIWHLVFGHSHLFRRAFLSLRISFASSRFACASICGTMPVRFGMQKTYKYVNNLWNDAEAASLDPVGRLIYRSNKLGEDQRITNTGGGNTSAKISEKDPLTGEQVEVLWVKGSGGDLRTSKRENFSSLYQDKLIALQKPTRAEPIADPSHPPRTTWWRCITTPPST